MMDATKDRRERNPRLPVGFSVTYGSAGALRQAIAANFSCGGIFLETDEKLPLDAVIELTFRLPQKEETFTLQGRVVHCQERDTATGRPAGLGLQFIQLDEALKRSLLTSLAEMEKAGVQEWKTPAAPPQVEAVFRQEIGEEVIRMISTFTKLGEQADYYAILGVKRNASGTEIQQAYHRFCRQFHPDLFLHTIPADGLRQLEEVYNKRTIAYRTLKTKASRLHYDLEHKITEASPEISAQEKQNFFKCQWLKKEQPEKAAKAEKLYTMALEEAGRGQKGSAITNLKLSLQLNPYDQRVQEKLSELEKGGH